MKTEIKFEDKIYSCQIKVADKETMDLEILEKDTLSFKGKIKLENLYEQIPALDGYSIEEMLSNFSQLNPEKFNITYAGTIRPVNNVGNLLDTAALLKTTPGYEDVQFLIYGDGMQLDELKKRVQEEKLDNVKLKGFVERKYIPFILSKSSVNMLNYSQDQYNWTRGNSSNKLFEYMASGKPVISTVHMGYSIINKYQCGVELDEDTPQALAQQIMRFHDMSKEERDRLGQNAKNGAADFDFNVLTDKLIHVIESVV